MNVREGMRRLGLVAGVLGAGFGAYLAYSQLQPLQKQRAQYRTFQSLISSPGVEKEIEFLKEDSATRHLGPWDKYLPAGPWVETPSGPWSSYASGIESKNKPPQRAELLDPDTFMAGQYRTQWIQYAEATALAGGAGGWRVDKSGVKAIYFGGGTDEQVAARWAGHLSAADISYVETSEGIVNRSDPPHLRSYLLTAAFPVLGFLLPWGAIKTVTWIGLGFSQTGNSHRG